jgi:quinol monooxygenase YgiN
MDSNDKLSLVTCVIDMRFDPKDVDRAVSLLLSVKGSIQTKHGCRACDVGMEAADRSLVHYREEWESEERFHRHVRSEEFRRVLIAVDMCSEEPRILVGNLSGEIGMAHLRKVREEMDRIRVDGNGSSTDGTDGIR